MVFHIFFGMVTIAGMKTQDRSLKNYANGVEKKMFVLFLVRQNKAKPKTKKQLANGDTPNLP